MNDCEESDFVFKWTNSCRLCLTSQVEFDIFRNDEDTRFMEKIKSCLNILIYRGDPMPQKLCLSCWEKLESWSSFREMCFDTDRNLRKRLKPFIKVDFVEEYLTKCSTFSSYESEQNRSSSLEPDLVGMHLLDDRSQTTEDDSSDARAISAADSTNCFDRTIKIEAESSDEVWAGEGLIANVAGGASGVFNCSAAENVQIKQELIGDVCPICHKTVQLSGDHICGTNYSDMTVVDVIVDVDAANSEGIEENSAAYNLRSKQDASNVSYEELEDWVEDEAVSQLSPRLAMQKITPFKCTECNIYFESKLALLGHYSSSECASSGSVRYSCKTCQRIYFSEEDLAEHQVQHLTIAYNLTVDELVRCSQCNLLFADDATVKQHAAVHANSDPPSRRYNCAKCQTSFVDRRSYDKHRKTHNSARTQSTMPTRSLLPPPPQLTKRPLAATVPAKKSAASTVPAKRPAPSTPSTIPPATRQSPSTPMQPLKCNFCPKKFSDEERLIDHRFLSHGLPDERVNCQSCDLKFPDLKALAAHALSHRPGPVARKTTTQPPVRRLSTRKEPPVPTVTIEDVDVKVETKTIRCRRCGRIFKTKDDLLQHEMTIHKNLSPHYCRKCSRRFVTRSQLLFHYRSHFKGQPSVEAEPEPEPEPVEVINDCEDEDKKLDNPRLLCLVCDVQFHHQHDLTVHETTHGLSPGRKHLTKNIFKAGQCLVYKYQCNKCPQLFCSRGSLNRHRDSAHVGEQIDFLRLRRGVIAKKTEGFPCSQCNATFLSKSKRTLHFRQEHRINISDEKLEMGNEQNAVGNGCVPCQFCNKIFNYSYIARHIRQEHRVMGEGSKRAGYQCRFCSKICSTSFNLQKHESCHDPDRKHTFLCKFCGQGSDSHSVYQKHKKQCAYVASKRTSPVVVATPPTPPSSAPPRPVPPESMGMSFDEYKLCRICLNSYETTSLLELHVMTAHGVEAFQRLEISKPKQMAPANEPRLVQSEPRQELWNEEANSIIRRVEGGFRCTYCDIHLSNVMSAMYHRSQHPHGNLYIVQVDENVFQCTVCPRVLRTRHEALYHAEVHAEPKDVKPPPLQGPLRSFNCPFCSSTFNCEDSIRSHIYYVHPEGVGNPL